MTPVYRYRTPKSAAVSTRALASVSLFAGPPFVKVCFLCLAHPPRGFLKECDCPECLFPGPVIDILFTSKKEFRSNLLSFKISRRHPQALDQISTYKPSNKSAPVQHRLHKSSPGESRVSRVNRNLVLRVSYTSERESIKTVSFENENQFLG